MPPGRLKLRPDKRPFQSAQSQRATAETHDTRSGILPLIRENLFQHKSTIFDLAPPTSKKCTYLCGSGNQVYWDNLAGSISHTLEDHAAGDVSSRLSKWQPPQFQNPLSMVLAWCYFDYLSLDDITGLFKKLDKFFIKGSRFYFLIQHSPQIPASVPVFELELDDVLHYSTAGPSREAPRYAPKQLEQLMPGFEIEKLYLTSSGLQEHLFYKRH